MSLLCNLSAWPDEEQGLIPSQELSLQNVGASALASRRPAQLFGPDSTRKVDLEMLCSAAQLQVLAQTKPLKVCSQYPCVQAHLDSKAGSWQSSPVPLSRRTNRHTGSARGLADGCELGLCMFEVSGAGRAACVLDEVKEQEVQITNWLEEQKCSNRILLSTTSQHPVPDARQARYAAGQLVVNQLCRAAPPPLRELLQGRRPRSRTSCFGCSPRTEKWASDDGARRPAVQNPWDRPSGVVKVSEACVFLQRAIAACFSQNASPLVQVASCEKGIHPARAALYRNPGPGYEFAR